MAGEFSEVVLDGGGAGAGGLGEAGDGEGEVFEAAQGFVFHGLNGGADNFVPLGGEAGEVHKDGVGGLGLEVPFDEAADEGHGKDGGEEFPVAVEDFADADIG